MSFKDALARWVANYLPERVVYFAAIRLGARATTGEHSTTVVPELGFIEALSRWQPLGVRHVEAEENERRHLGGRPVRSGGFTATRLYQGDSQ